MKQSNSASPPFFVSSCLRGKNGFHLLLRRGIAIEGDAHTVSMCGERDGHVDLAAGVAKALEVAMRSATSWNPLHWRYCDPVGECYNACENAQRFYRPPPLCSRTNAEQPMMAL